MVESVDLAKEPPEDAMDLVDAYRIHSVVGINALKRIVEGPLKKRDRPDRRDMAVRILDSLHSLSTIYRGIANELASKEDFPERAEKWPTLFRQYEAQRRRSSEEEKMTQTDESQEIESISDIVADLERLLRKDVRGTGNMLELAAKSPQNESARGILKFLFDQAHNSFEFYKALAVKLLHRPEETDNDQNR